MADRDRRGMWIKNSGREQVCVEMASREVCLDAGEETLVAPDEVRDPILRRALQERSISIVRPATEAEDDHLRERLDLENS